MQRHDTWDVLLALGWYRSLLRQRSNWDCRKGVAIDR